MDGLTCHERSLGGGAQRIHVEEADPLVERVADDLGESPHAQAGLVAGLSRAHGAGSHPHERDLDAGLAQGDLLGRALG